VTLPAALTNSINRVWGRVGEIVGKDTMFTYMRRFGFNSKPPIDLPGSELRSSGVFSNGKLLDESDDVDIGRVAIGQERLLVTPLQMAMVASTIANDGKLMRPRLVQEV